MKIFDSVKKTKLDFIPIEDNKVKIYVCGPTVYDDSHLGHARSAIAFDLLRRFLIHSGYEVTFIKNITDIDDKIINKAIQENTSIQNISDTYTSRYHEEMDLLNVLRPDNEPKATDALDSMYDLIQILIDKDIAYILDDGVYFDVSRDKEYNSISSQAFSENEIARVSSNEHKRNEGDFALWKLCKSKDDIGFDSPFGKGRPGWHIECSAMIDELSYSDKYAIDIHGGGMDLLFPHHENEAAQTRCAKDQNIAKYWMHNGFVSIDGEKMSKSLGNSFFIKDIIKEYHPEILRFYLLSTHYRSNINFSIDALKASKKRLDKLYRIKKRVYETTKKHQDKEFEEEFNNALSDDLNISKALSHMDAMIQKYNDILDLNPKDKIAKQKIVSNLNFISNILAIGTLDAYKYFQLGLNEDTAKEIEKLIEQREHAKKQKDFQKADEIRDEITTFGISIMDTNEGTKWEKI